MPARIAAVHPVLGSRDVAASVAFFARLGFRTLFLDVPSSPRYAAVARDDAELHLQWNDPSALAQAGDRPTYRFLDDDVDALHEELLRSGALEGQKAGRSPYALPADTPWGTRELHVRDPDGNGLQFYRPL